MARKSQGEKPAILKMADRNMDICRARARGRPWHSIAAEYELDERRCKQIWDEWKNVRKPLLRGRDAIDIVWETIERYEAWIEQAGELALTATADTAIIGAINTQARLQEKQTELLQATGILPHNLGKLRIEADVRWLVRKIIDVFNENGIPQDVQDEIMQVVSARSN